MYICEKCFEVIEVVWKEAGECPHCGNAYWWDMEEVQEIHNPTPGFHTSPIPRLRWEES